MQTTKRREKNKPRKLDISNSLAETQKEVNSKPREKNELAITFGKFCLDLAKLTYGGVFLSAIMQLSYDMSLALMYGALAIILLSVLGLVFVKIGNK